MPLCLPSPVTLQLLLFPQGLEVGMSCVIGAAQPSSELARVLLWSGRVPERAFRNWGISPFSSLSGRWQLWKGVFYLLNVFHVPGVWWLRIAQEKTLADQSESRNPWWFGLQRTLKTQSSSPCHGQGHLPPVQPGLGQF